MRKISIVIPAFNEEKTIATTLKRVYKLALTEAKKEIIVVNDGSKDNTGQILDELKKEFKGIKVINMPKNSGKGAAVKEGIKNTTGDIIVIQDADLEYNPNDIPRLVEPIIQKRARVVYGTRLNMEPKFFGKNKTPLLLNFFGNKFLSLLTSVIYGQKISDMETGYKVFDKKSLSGVKLKSRSFDFEPEITAKIFKKGIRILEIDIKTNPRGYDEGKKIRPFKDGVIALWTLLKYRFSD